MVRRVIKMVYTEVRGLHQAAYILGLFAFGSQLLALVRDRLLAHQFGAGIELDLYYAAFRVPDIMYVLFASMLSVYVLIPLVTTRSNHEDGAGARFLLSQVFSAFLVCYMLLAALLALLAPFLVPILFPGMVGESAELVTLMRILLLQPLFLGISSLFGVVTQLGHRFVLYAISPLIYNLGIIIGISVLYPYFGLTGLVWGVVIGAFGHMLVQFPLVQSSALAFGFTKKISYTVLREVLVVSVPRASTLALHQVVLLVFVSIASTMTVGSVAVWQFAYNLQAVPLAIIGASYSIAAFPMLADLYAKDHLEQFRTHVVAAIRHIIFWSVPIVALVIVLRAQMVRVLLGSGAFDWSDTRLVAAVLALLVLSLSAQALYLLIVRTFYAAGHTRIPFLVTLAGTVFAISLALLFVWFLKTHDSIQLTVATFLRVESVSGSEVLALALAYTVAVMAQAVVLLFVVMRHFSINFGWLWAHLGRSVMAAVVGALTAYVTLNFIVSGINQDTFIGIFIQGLLAGVAGIAGVVYTYYIFRSPELFEVYRSCRGRLFKTDVVAPQEDIL